MTQGRQGGLSKLSLYRHPNGRTALHESGYSWVAAFMLPLWLLLHGFKAWAVLLAVVLPTASVLLAQSIWSDERAALLWLLQALLIGGLTGPCYRWYLLRQAWVKVAQEGEP